MRWFANGGDAQGHVYVSTHRYTKQKSRIVLSFLGTHIIKTCPLNAICHAWPTKGRLFRCQRGNIKDKSFHMYHAPVHSTRDRLPNISGPDHKMLVWLPWRWAGMLNSANAGSLTWACRPHLWKDMYIFRLIFSLFCGEHSIRKCWGRVYLSRSVYSALYGMSNELLSSIRTSLLWKSLLVLVPKVSRSIMACYIMVKLPSGCGAVQIEWVTGGLMGLDLTAIWKALPLIHLQLINVYSALHQNFPW